MIKAMAEFIFKSVMPSTPHAQFMETEECKCIQNAWLKQQPDSDDTGPRADKELFSRSTGNEEEKGNFSKSQHQSDLRKQ